MTDFDSFGTPGISKSKSKRGKLGLTGFQLGVGIRRGRRRFGGRRRMESVFPSLTPNFLEGDKSKSLEGDKSGSRERDH